MPKGSCKGYCAVSGVPPDSTLRGRWQSCCDLKLWRNKSPSVLECWIRRTGKSFAKQLWTDRLLTRTPHDPHSSRWNMAAATPHEWCQHLDSPASAWASKSYHGHHEQACLESCSLAREAKPIMSVIPTGSAENTLETPIVLHRTNRPVATCFSSITFVCSAGRQRNRPVTISSIMSRQAAWCFLPTVVDRYTLDRSPEVTLAAPSIACQAHGQIAVTALPAALFSPQAFPDPAQYPLGCTCRPNIDHCQQAPRAVTRRSQKSDGQAPEVNDQLLVFPIRDAHLRCVHASQAVRFADIREATLVHQTPAAPPDSSKLQAIVGRPPYLVASNQVGGSAVSAPSDQGSLQHCSSPGGSWFFFFPCLPGYLQAVRQTATAFTSQTPAAPSDSSKPHTSVRCPPYLAVCNHVGGFAVSAPSDQGWSKHCNSLGGSGIYYACLPDYLQAVSQTETGLPLPSSVHNGRQGAQPRGVMTALYCVAKHGVICPLLMQL